MNYATIFIKYEYSLRKFKKFQHQLIIVQDGFAFAYLLFIRCYCHLMLIYLKG